MLLRRTGTAGKILLRETNQDRVLPDAFDHIPRNDKIVTLPDPEKAGASLDDQCQNPLTFLIKLKIRRIAESRAVA